VRGTCLLAVWLGVAAACTPGSSVTADARAGEADAPIGQPDAGPLGTLVVYVGAGDDRIHVYSIDEDTLALGDLGSVVTGAGPSFLAFDPKGRWLVAVNEGGNAVESFAIAPGTGALTRVDGASTLGAGPAHVAVDRTGAWVLAANYGDGTVAVLPIAAGGTFGAASDSVAAGANAHEVVLDAANQVAYVPCLGADHIAVYGFSAVAGTLNARTPAPAQAGAGPRHLALSPDGQVAWVVNETASSVTTYTVGAQGLLTAQGTVSTLPAGFSGTNTGAEIAVHPSGKWVYASNRGDDSIAIFAVGAGGALTPMGHVKTGGARPRHFSLALEGRALLVANQDGGSIVGFHVDAQTGLLTTVGQLTSVTGPEFVGVLRLPAP
jgi:6-phosphogluconolactonase